MRKDVGPALEGGTSPGATPVWYTCRLTRHPSGAESASTRGPAIPDDLAARLYRVAGAGTWSVPPAAFAAALEASAGRAFADARPGARELERYLRSLHLADLALATACGLGIGAAWDHFVLQFRPGLYRAADALDRTGGARELADALYADLYGIEARRGDRRSLFRYFHGRSSLPTWLRAVLSQRHVDQLRSGRRLEPLPADEEQIAAPVRVAADPDRPRYLALIHRALIVAVASLDPRDRLRLACYYVQQITLAEIGRLLGEHEATASRHLSATRKAIRTRVEQHLGTQGLSDAEVASCFESVIEDSGALDLSRILARKDAEPDRSV